MPVTRVPDHIEQGLDRLLTQYQGKPRLRGWLKSYLRQVQLLEDAIFDVIVKRLLDRAVGAQLDVIGRIVGEARLGREDGEYKTFIRARIRINRSEGSTKDVLEVLAMITATPLLFDEYYPAAMALEFATPTEYDPVRLFAMLRDAKAGGVKLSMVVPTAPPETRFLWGDVTAPSVHDNGFGDAASPGAFGLLSDAVSLR